MPRAYKPQWFSVGQNYPTWLPSKESVCNSIGSDLVPSLWCRPSWKVLFSKDKQTTLNRWPAEDYTFTM